MSLLKYTELYMVKDDFYCMEIIPQCLTFKKKLLEEIFVLVLDTESCIQHFAFRDS